LSIMPCHEPVEIDDEELRRLYLGAIMSLDFNNIKLFLNCARLIGMAKFSIMKLIKKQVR